MRNTYKILVEKPEGKITLWILWRRWQSNVKKAGGRGLDASGSG
jgi:hypothetical protein